jgi:hypothetical protein
MSNPIVNLIKSMGHTPSELAREAGIGKDYMHQITTLKRPPSEKVRQVFNKYGIIIPEIKKVEHKSRAKAQQLTSTIRGISSGLASTFPDSSMVERAAVNR